MFWIFEKKQVKRRPAAVKRNIVKTGFETGFETTGGFRWFGWLKGQRGKSLNIKKVTENIARPGIRRRVIPVEGSSSWLQD